MTQQEASAPAPRASIVVPSRAGAQRLPVLLRALAAQREKDFEVIVVLDGDVDGSRDVLARPEVRGDLDLRVIEFPENRGRVAALNAGFDAARGVVYIRCDDDFEPDADYVALHVAAHEDDTPRGVIGLATNVYEETAYATVHGHGAEERHHAEAYACAPEDRWQFWSGNVSVDAATYAAIGPYDPAYRAYGWEDVDWGYRLARAGVEIVFEPRLATLHHAAAVTVELRARRAFQSGSAMNVFLRRHPERADRHGVPWTLWLTLVRAVALLPPSVTFFLARRLDAALTSLPPALSRRLVALLVEGSVLGGRRRSHYTDLEI